MKKKLFKNYLQGLKLSKQFNNVRGVSIALNGIGNVFLNTEQYEDLYLNQYDKAYSHISNGLNNEEISQKMFVSKNTIKTHITDTYSKLNVKSRVQAIQKTNKK